jgi:hypothetical protein
MQGDVIVADACLSCRRGIEVDKGVHHQLLFSQGEDILIHPQRP